MGRWKKQGERGKSLAGTEVWHNNGQERSLTSLPLIQFLLFCYIHASRRSMSVTMVLTVGPLEGSTSMAVGQGRVGSLSEDGQNTDDGEERYCTRRLHLVECALKDSICGIEE